MGKQKKTNALRIVEQQKIPYDLIEYATDDGLIDGLSVAEKTGQDPNSMFKTLVAQTSDQQIVVFLLPLTKELHLKQAARFIHAKKLDLLPVAQLTKETGYVRGGCSPIGMRKAYPTFIDESAYSLDNIVISAGRPGLQMKLSPADLIRLTNAKRITI